MQRFHRRLILGLACGVCVLAATIWVIDAAESLQAQLSARLTATSMVARIKKSIANRAVLKFSAEHGRAPGNRALLACLEPGTQEECQVTDAASQVSFTAMLPRQRGETLPLAGTLAAGEQPVYYSLGGTADCDQGQTDCPGWQVVAYFWALCPEQAKRCAQAEAVMVRFQVLPLIADFSDHAWPNAAVFAAEPESFAIPVAVMDRWLARQGCRATAVATGYDARGEVHCAPGRLR